MRKVMHRNSTSRFFFFLFFIVMLLQTAAAFALKVNTHVWVAQQVLNDLTPDGKVTIEPFGEFTVHPDIVEALRQYRDEYRMGSSGPDVFPDLAGGQMTVHPGLDNGWKTDEWLKWMLSGADTPGKLAYAYGYLTHAAGDVFSHTYVNTYAGDLFNFMDGLEEELRHMLLEGYIVDYTPPIRDNSDTILQPYNIVESPAEFLRDRLILNQAVADQYRKVPVTVYLAGMHDFWKKLGEIIAEMNQVEEMINGTINKIQEEIDSFQQEIDRLQQEIDDLKNQIPFPGYPALCFLDPTFAAICATIESTQLTLEGTQASLELVEQSLQFAQELNTIAIDHVRVPLELWRNQIEEAVKQYIVTSQEVGKEIMKGHDGDPVQKLERWVCEWASVFIAVPNVATLPLCATNDFIGEIKDGISSFRSKVSDKLDILGWLVDPMQKIDELIEGELKPQFENLAMNITEELTGEDSIMTSLLRMWLEEHDADALNAEYSADSSSKGLLLIPDIASRIDADMHLTEEGYFDPEKFNMIYNTVVISKLLLLGPAELNRLVREAGVTNTVYGENLYHGPEDPFHENPFNILFGAVRSIDGNQQWQEYGVPYPRLNLDDRPPDSMPLENRQYGYGFDESMGLGFRLWQDCDAQEKVFKRIFHGPVAPGIEEPASLGLTDILHELDLNRADSVDKPFTMPLIEDRDGDGIKDECDPGPATLPVGSKQLYSSIQKAIDYAWDGDTVLVYDGTYYENIDFYGKAITVRSKNGADSTTINGGAGDSVVTFSSGEGSDSLLDGFNITNGSSLAGNGGIFIGDSSPSIINCTVKDNLGDGIYASGGSARIENCAISSNGNNGIYCDNSSLAVVDCTISNNSDNGINVFGGSAMIENCTVSVNGGYGMAFSSGTDSLQTITDCTISGNVNGGVYASDGSMEIENSTISDNNARGIHCKGSLQVTISDCIVTGNHSDENGGGIFTENSSLLTLIDSTVSGNSAGINGGGIYCYEDSSPTIINCTFSDNSALLMGGGIYCHSGSSPTLKGCTINGNTAEFGGGVYCFENSSPTLTNSHITNNSASSILMGGGIYCWYSSLSLNNCTVNNNQAMVSGGGIYGWHSSLTITDSIVSGNSTSAAGSGIYCFDSSSLSITNSTISENSGSYAGGGIYCFQNSSLTVNDCIISGNSAGSGGGIYCYDTPSPSFTNCIISGNSANDDGSGGGGIFFSSCSSSPEITNCTISDNSAVESGGGIYCAFNSSPTMITNTILWGNTAGISPNEIYLEDAGSSVTITYSDINPSYIAGSGASSRSNNINADPKFVDPDSGDYHLQYGSPCIDKGTSSGAPATDIEEISRPRGAGYDMGAYEFQGDTGDCLHDGNINGDDNITPQDALMAFQHYLGIITLDDCQQDHADVNPDGIGDGSVTPADALCIFQKYLGLSSCLD